MKSAISKVIGSLVAIHLLTILTVIFFPQSLRSTIVYTVYTRYLLPGPFFSENAIGDTYQLSVAWKEDNSWSEPVNPALDNYKQFVSGDVRLINKNRMDRMLYQRLISKDSVSDKWIDDKEKMSFLKLYYKAHYIPSHADSVRLIVAHQDSRGFTTKTDTLQIVQF